ncbi:glycosyltransferase [Mycobacterium sp. M1]|uniref:Glycosyltransferase n=1 Tax=Mycolicibacter acidiphilus TaxID=2835306 RepID=A0ABS5RMH6_9MYCO|nr:glycosyltransferase [Mycolicibacter acidiphilus]MBS9535507.1 glycosyltransferase [Mycolicibacter acidiphilus]
MRNPGLPKVAIFGVESMDQLPGADQLRSHEARVTEADTFAFSLFADDRDLPRILNELDPQCIVTIGDIHSFTNLMAAPHYIRSKWIHKDRAADLRGIEMLNCFLAQALSGCDGRRSVPKVSVYTPVYNTGRERLLRTWRSLRRQSYDDWEWVVVDDHSSDPGTLAALDEIRADYRVSFHRLEKPSGNIGELKGYLCSVATGDIFLELDHDDVLTPDAIAWIVDAFAQHPECGVAYTNWAEQYEGELVFHDYGEDYAYGYGKAHWEWHPENYATCEQVKTRYLVQDSLRINSATIRWIVGVPNHIRAWTRKAYHEAGGYSSLHVADDYELLVRSFLTTRFVHIPKLGYIQFYNTESIGNTQHSRNKEIQRVVRFVSGRYETRIHDRLLELGVDDYIWTPSGLDYARPRPEPESHCSVICEG